ncbi:MAG: hypothetical protein ACOYKR_14080, partial [Sphingobacterium thalpophilum]
RCTGFKAVHVRGVQTDLYIPEIGWFTASFNSLKEEAIVTPVSAQSSYNPEVSHEFQTLDVELLRGQLVVGVYVDCMKLNVFAPYIVSLYLRCTEILSRPIQKQNLPKKELTEMVEKTNPPTGECLPDEDEEDDQELISEDSNPDQLCSIT